MKKASKKPGKKIVKKVLGTVLGVNKKQIKAKKVAKLKKQKQKMLKK
tara:strand:- start:456 stop:596 length:141 start_codon:yes stop_codon:yes gene_type:complete